MTLFIIASTYYPCSGVGLTFLFGFLLLVFSAVVFFFGANAQKVCQALEGPEYPLFSEVCWLHECIYHLIIYLCTSLLYNIFNTCMRCVCITSIIVLLKFYLSISNGVVQQKQFDLETVSDHLVLEA